MEEKDLQEILMEKHNIIKELRKGHEEAIESKIRIFNKYMEKLLPTFKFIRERMYFFGHPATHYITKIGPIIGHNKEEGLLFAYEVEKERIVVINTHDTEDVKPISTYKFFRERSFKDVIDGLTYNEKLLDIIIDELNEIKNKDEKEIENYNID
ncbi:hypothetical protein [Clostridium sp. YIM B02506]|uniref:hypothetical protein n=1 Tax=Clostridium sp. YIM B02506 TaxID=2910680 RepID=UPI001EEDBBC7|nr:hypothetical protein [Clostridium sp. YIM B02506]